ncbi:uncharacterized protein LOC110250149 [Exaiptasia diaphana]|uniref:Potassium channel domain-containing protein n=1 Tax=Exaiptasia diaphana TaxID=2652724 RepID=A0A913YUV2_EXADI|nr:uncharacterized protein LOC110250149 [Exaiptasia diaphana]
MSFDERCQSGYPLSMAWLPNEPYSGVTGPRTINGSKGMVAYGIFPGIINQMVQHCCPRSKIKYAKMLRAIRDADRNLKTNSYDFTYPVYVQKWKSKTYKDKPFVPVVQAPRVMLIVYDDIEARATKTSLLVNTIFSAWPFLLFILGVAMTAGLVVWMLEKVARSQEFTVKFATGAWDGFWWAVVTMTTVGYGDKAPKSIPGRLFCLLWIIVGINIVATFTALITATVTANTQPYFNINGAKIGAVDGSEEFRLGVQMGAFMIGFKHPSKMTKALKAHDIDGLLIDNYALTRFSKFFETEKTIRLESTIDHRISYGMVLPSGNTKTETCIRKYMKNYRQETFGSISKQLRPLSQRKGSQSDYSVEAAGLLFYQEGLFTDVIQYGCACVGSLVVIGLIWELAYRRHKEGFHRLLNRLRGFSSPSKGSSQIEEKLANEDLTTIERKRKELVMEHRRFQTKWIDQLSNLNSTRQK